jgi:hypothetical protein
MHDVLLGVAEPENVTTSPFGEDVDGGRQRRENAQSEL